MNITEYSALIVQELGRTLSSISDNDGEKFSDMILGARKILLAGAGRSGLSAKAFTMRLMHMGFDAYVCGETVTPNLEHEDIFIVVSGSGETGSLVSMTSKAQQIGAKIVAVTVLPKSTIGLMSDLAIKIPAPTPKAEFDKNIASVQPMGSLFEQSCLIFFDAVILRLMERKHNDSGNMFRRHANLE